MAIVPENCWKSIMQILCAQIDSGIGAGHLLSGANFPRIAIEADDRIFEPAFTQVKAKKTDAAADIE